MPDGGGQVFNLFNEGQIAISRKKWRKIKQLTKDLK